LLHPGVPQPAGSLVYELLTGHPEREPGELVFVADLTVELRAWPNDTWTAVGVDPDRITQAVVGCWQDGTYRRPHGRRRRPPQQILSPPQRSPDTKEP
jgi:hypothetical protein